LNVLSNELHLDIKIVLMIGTIVCIVFLKAAKTYTGRVKVSVRIQLVLNMVVSSVGHARSVRKQQINHAKDYNQVHALQTSHQKKQLDTS